MSAVVLHTNEHMLPRRSIDSPPRLISIIPPANFGAVVDGLLYRSAFPQPHNVEFMKGMHLKTVLCLVDTENSRECSDFMDDQNVKLIRRHIAANKDGQVKTSLESIYEALLVVMDVANYPLLIHCNQGRHRTGCVIACLRRMQGWSDQAALEEYRTYSNPKAREGDELLISKIFQPEDMLEYAKSARFDHRPSLVHLLRSDLVDVSILVKILASMDGVLRDHGSLESNTSSKADSGVEIVGLADLGHDGAVKVIDFATLSISRCRTTDISSDDIEVSVDECGPLSPPLQ